MACDEGFLRYPLHLNWARKSIKSGKAYQMASQGLSFCYILKLKCTNTILY